MPKRKELPKCALEWTDRKPSFPCEMRWREFADEYIKDFNASAAYRRCTWTKSSETQSAKNASTRLMSLPPVQGYIKEAIEARKKRTHLDQDAVVLEQARIGLSNISEFLKWDNNGIHITPSENLSDDALRALEMIEIYETDLGGGVIKRRIKFKLHSKAPALESLAKHFGMYTEKHEHTHKFGVIKVPMRVEPSEWLDAVSRELEQSSDGYGDADSDDR